MGWRNTARPPQRSKRAQWLGASARIAAAVEPLEKRLLFTVLMEPAGNNNYLVNGVANTLVVTPLNGTPGSPIDLSPYTGVNLIGGGGPDGFTITNYSGTVSIDGAGGNNTYTINTGAGGSVSVTDSVHNNPDTLIVHSSSSVPATTTLSAGQVTVGADTITYDSKVDTLSLFGTIFGSGDALVVNGTSSAESYTVAGSKLTMTGQPAIFYHSYTLLTINGNGGNDSFDVSSVAGPTVLNAGAGNVSFEVDSNSDNLTLNSGSSGVDTFTINNNSGTLVATGSGADDHYTVENSASGMTLNGGTGANTFDIVSNSASLTLNGGAGDTSDSFDIQSNSGSIHANGGSGTDSFEVDSTTAPITLQGGSGNDTFHVTAPTFASVTVTGGTGPTQALEYDGSSVADAFVITSTQITGPLAPLPYSKLTSLTVEGGGGADTFTVLSDSAPTTLIGGTENDTFNIEADSASDPVTVDTGSGASTINIGSNAPSTGGKLDNIKGGVTVNGDGLDNVNIDDTGASIAKTGTLSNGALSGFSPAPIQYSGINILSLMLGSHGNTLTVSGTSATTTNINSGSGNDFVYVQTTGDSTTTNVNTGAGTNTVDVGSTAPTAGGTLSFIQGALFINGAGADILNLDDSGSSSSKTGTLNANTVHGLSPADITYSGIATLSIALGNVGNNFTIITTNATTTTTLTGGSGGDTLLLETDAGTTHIIAGSGTNQVSIDATGAPTTVKDLSGTTTVLVGSTEPTAGGLLNTIAFSLDFTGNSKDTLTLDDTGDLAAQTTGKVTATAVTGLGLDPTGVTYSGIGTLNVNLGNGGNKFLVMDTSASVATVINSGSGNDTVTVQHDSTPTTINSGLGNDTVYVKATGGNTTVNMGSGTDTVYVSNNAPNAGDLQLILSPLTINGTSLTTVTLDDTGNPTAESGTLSASELSGIAPANIFYSGLGILNLNLGTGGNTLAVTGTSATTTNINTGSGADTVNVSGTGTGTTTNLNTGGGTNVNTVNVGDAGSDVGNILGTLAITGNSHDILNIDNAASTVPNTATLTSTSLTGLTAQPITWSGIATFSLSLGTKNNLLTVNSTITGSTTINGGGNIDAINLLNENGPVTVNSGAGNDVIYIPVTNAAVTVNDSGGADAINVGSSSPPSGGVLANIKSPLTVNGDGSDTLNLDDSGDTSARTATITSSSVMALSPATINYSTVANLNVYLGTGIDTVNVQSTSASTDIFTGAKADTINVGSGGSTSGINGPLTVTGTANADILTVDDSADSTPTTGSLTATTLTGVSPQPITYAGVATLTVDLGTGGNTFTINNTNAATTTTLNTGSGMDTVTLITDSSPTTINTQGGSDTVYVQATGALTTINTGVPGADTIDVGSILPPPTFNHGVLSGVQGKLVVNGNGEDTLNLDDSGDATSHSAAMLTPTALTGLGAAEIDFSKLGSLNLALGTGNNTLTVTGTAAGTSTAITTAGGTDTFNVQATGAPLSITTGGSNANTVNIGSKAPLTGGNVDGIVGAVTITGDTNDILNVDDTGSAANRTGTLSGTSLTLGPATVNYSGLAALNVNLGTGKDTFTISNTAAGATTTVKTLGIDTINVQQTSSNTNILTGSTATTVNVGNGGLTGGIAASLTIMGTASAAIVSVDDSADTAPTTASLTSTAITGLTTNPIGYSGAAKLVVSLGIGGNTFTINSTNASTNTTLNSGASGDTVTLVADSGPTTINTQAGNDNVYVNSTGGTTAVNTGSGTDLVLVGSLAPALGGTLAGISGALSVTADPTTLTLDDTADTFTKSGVVVSATQVTGLSPAAITYSGLTNLNVDLGSGGDTVKVTGSASGTNTVITGGSGSETFSVVAPSTSGLPAVLAGPVTIDGGSGGSDTLTVDDSLDKTGRTVGLTSSTVTGLGATITYLDLTQFTGKLGTGNDTLNITSIATSTPVSFDGGTGTNSATLTITGDFNSSLTLTNFQSTAASITGIFNGTLSTTGGVSNMTVGGNLAGVLFVGGKLTMLTFGGDDTGSITAGSVGTIIGKDATACAGGVVLSVTQANVLRQFIAMNAGGGTSDASFTLVYDGSTAATPQIAIGVVNLGPRFDVLLTSPVGSNFDLSRINSINGAAADIRNVTVEGDILATVSAPESNYLGSPTVAGVYLPLDSVAAVAAWGNIFANTIRVNSIEGIAFATLTNGSSVTKATALTSESSEATLLLPLAKNPTTKKYYEAVALPTETLNVVFNAKAAVALFVDGTEGNDDAAGQNPTTNNGDFEEHGMVFTDQGTGAAASAPITASATFASNSAKRLTSVQALSFVGDGASVDSTVDIQSITSTGALGNLYLRDNAPKDPNPLPLIGITAPSIFGNIDLFGGTLTGIIQTTGVRIDPVTGAPGNAPADLGATVTSSGKVTGVTTLHANLAAGAEIISRGNLISQVNVDTNLLGLIAAQGNIGVGVVSGSTLTRFGGIKVGTGISSGQIIALGNIFGAISIGGSLTGRIAAEGSAITGLASTRFGILGSVTISSGLAAGGAVISSGLIGDSTGGTKLTISNNSVAGFVAAKGAVTSLTIPTGHLFQNQTGANLAAIAAIWTNGGSQLAFDVSPGDLVGLGEIVTDAVGLKVSGTSLTGTTA